MNLVGRHNSFPFQNCVKPVYRQTFEYFGRPTWPSDFQRIDLVSRTQTEVNAQIVLRQVAATTVNLFSLSNPARDDCQSCPNRKTVAFDSR